MKIGIVSPMFPSDQAGIAWQAFWQAKILAEKDEVTVFTLRPRFSVGRLDDDAKQFKIIRYSRPRGLIGLIIFWPIFFSFCRRFRQLDILNLHGDNLLVWAAALAAWVCGKPYVVTLHGSEVWRYQASQFNIFTQVCARARKIVSVSQGLADRWQKVSGLNSQVIYPAIGENYFQDEPKVAATKIKQNYNFQPLILNVKGLYPVADQETLLRAFKLVLPQFSGAGLLLIGSGPLREELEKLANELEINPRVKFLGEVDNQELKKYYLAADLVVATPKEESLGIWLLESLAVGTKAVSTPTVGAKELQKLFPARIFLAQNNSPEIVAAAIGRALTSTLVSEYTNFSRFQPKIMAEQYRQLYE